MASADAIPLETHDWTKRPLVRVVVLGSLALALVSAALLGLGVLSEDAAFSFSQIIYTIVPAGAGVVVMGAALTQSGRSRIAWLAIGAGVFAWGVGEIIWVYYEAILQVEVPYPGWADVFYVGGYPLVFAGVLLLPHVKPGRLERVRLSIDALAGSIAVAAIMWVTYLGDQIFLDPEIGFLEQFVNIMYPMGDVFLLVTLMILAVRRSAYRFDPRLLAVSISLIIAFVADFIYIIQVEADTYISGGWLDAVWLVDNAALIVAAWYLLRPLHESEQIERSSRIWQLGAPYAAIALLFAMTLWDIGGDASVLEIASGLVGLLVVGRQGVAIRENRELVENQRNDLIASISHELRTPLTGVTGFAALLNTEWEALSDDERAEMISIVDNQAQHVNRIVTDLIGIARDTLQSTDLELDNHDVDLIARDAIAMVPGITDSKVDIDVEVEQGLEVVADRGRLIQVMVNLFNNALNYGNGQILFRAHASSVDVLFEVHDNGSGVPKRYEEAIWDRYERGAHRFDSIAPGSGIGLPIARSLIEAHRGTIRYRRSQQLGGACFIVSIPLASITVDPAQRSTTAAA